MDQSENLLKLEVHSEMVQKNCDSHKESKIN
jgi:hypothetical protein